MDVGKPGKISSLHPLELCNFLFNLLVNAAFHCQDFGGLRVLQHK